MAHTLYFAVSAEDQVFGPYESILKAKESLVDMHNNDEISTLEGISIFEGTEILTTSYALHWTKAK